MEEKQKEKTPRAVQKSFMTAGPTLHYSHKNVQRCWLLALGFFILSCFFWSRIVLGSLWAFDLRSLLQAEAWRLDQFVVMGANVFEYPWQILVLGLMVGIFGIVPVLISQLMSFRYSLPFIAAVFFLAALPALAVALFISCFAAACRPLRFRSRIIAIALCTAPQLICWGFLGGASDASPVEWGFSFTPWICAWLSGMALAGFVLGIGHFTRYKPGLVWIFTAVTLTIAAVVFEKHIGFDELDYQLYVADYSPEQAKEFHDHLITDALDATIDSPSARKHFMGFFFPTEPIPLRAELKRRIQFELSYDRWPTWFIVPEELQYQKKRKWLNEQYDRFISPPKPWWMPGFIYDEFIKSRSQSKRMAIALYYKALLSEYSPDTSMIAQEEILHFYSDYPHERSAQLWHELYRNFSNSAESIEARWRIAMHWAGKGRFTQADALLNDAQIKARQRVQAMENQEVQDDTIFKPFRPPAETAITSFKLNELQRKIDQLRTLIGQENRTSEPSSGRMLAEFVMLNPHSQDYSWHIDRLLDHASEKAPLRDNLLVAKAKLAADEQLRAERLLKVHEDFSGTDGGIQALYELGLLKISQWRQLPDTDSARKKRLLAEARATLSKFVSLYPESIYSEQVNKNLAGLPASG